MSDDEGIQIQTEGEEILDETLEDMDQYLQDWEDAGNRRAPLHPKSGRMITSLEKIPTLYGKYGVAKHVLDKISVWKGDITKIGVDCVVNAANEGLSGGGGVDGAIHRAAGYYALQEECSKYSGCSTGDAVITGSCRMEHIKNIIHAVGPQIRRRSVVTLDEREKLVSCYSKALDLAVENGRESVAFCCISTGIYGYPNRDAAQSVGAFLTSWLAKSEHRNKIKRVVLCVFLEIDERCYEEFFGDYASYEKRREMKAEAAAKLAAEAEAAKDDKEQKMDTEEAAPSAEANGGHDDMKENN